MTQGPSLTFGTPGFLEVCADSVTQGVTLHFPSCPPLPLVHTHRGHASPSSGSSPNPSSCHVAVPCTQLFGEEIPGPWGPTLGLQGGCGLRGVMSPWPHSLCAMWGGGPEWGL